MKVSLVSFVYPRLEWPFIAEWGQYYSNLVDEINLVIHWPDSVIWGHREDYRYYHLEMTNSEIDDCFQKEIQKIPTSIRLYYGNNSLGITAAQAEFWGQMKLDTDWIVSVDVDEFIVGDFKSLLVDKPIRLKQLVFDSRWIDGKPRRVRDIKNYYPKVINQHKCIYPNGCLQIRPHNVVGESIVVNPRICRFHHFRGVEPAIHQELKKIESFTHVTQIPLELFLVNESC